MKRGDIYTIKLKENKDHFQSGWRYCILVANNTSIHESPVFQIVPTTCNMSRSYLPTRTTIEATGLPCTSSVMGEQVMLINKKYLGRKVGHLNRKQMAEVEKTIKIQLGLR